MDVTFATFVAAGMGHVFLILLDENARLQLRGGTHCIATLDRFGSARTWASNRKVQDNRFGMTWSLANNDNTGAGHRVMLPVLIQVEPNFKPCGNMNALFDNRMA